MGKEKVMGHEGDLLHPMVSQMAQFHKFIVLGTSMGELVFVDSDFFCSLHRKLYKPSKLYKYFKLFSSPITKIITFNDHIIVSSSKVNSIISLKVINSNDIKSLLLSIDIRD